MTASSSLRTAALAMSLMLLCLGANADTAAERGRVVYEQYKESVVTVHMVVSMSFQGQEEENDTWTNGTVITPDGLTAIPLTAADPLASYGQAMPPEMRNQIETETTSMEIVVQGERVPAESVIRDPDLDLMLVRPLEPPKTPWVHTDLGNIGEPGLLEETLVIMQLGEIARRAHTAMIARVEAIVSKPRTYYHLGEDRSDGLIAAPAFTLDGGFIGVGVYRTVRTGSDGGADVAVIVLPAADIADAVAQVPERVTVAKAETR